MGFFHKSNERTTELNLSQSRSGAPVSLWLLLRVLSFPVVLLAFSYDNTGRIVNSFRSFLLTPWYGYDAEYYIAIVRDGYQVGSITANFHPLYPWVSRVVAVVVRDPLVALLVVSSFAGLLLTITLYRLATLDYEHEKAWTATALMLCWPASLAIFAPYTEALFMLLSVCCFLAARKEKFWWASVAGGLATLTRQQGLFLTLPLAWELWDASGRSLRGSVNRWHSWVTILLIPGAYAGWIVYRAIAINDVKADFSSLHGFIYSVMLSPGTFSILDQQQFLPPWTAIWKALTILSRGEVHTAAYGDFMFGVLFIAMFVLGWRFLRTSYQIYSLAIILVALSFHTGQINPYISLPRHLVLAFPVFFGVAAAYRLRRPGFVLTMFALCQIGLLCSFVWQNWIL